jgi:preprotein translocase subunit SecY
VSIVSAKQLKDQNSELKSSYIPIKLNQGGIMPLVFSTTIATFLFYPLQLVFAKMFISEIGQLSNLLTLFYFILNLFLVVFFSTFYSLVVLKPKDLSDNLTKMTYNVPGLKQGRETTRYLEQIVSRLGFMGGIFLAFLAFFPLLVGNLFQFNIFKNLTSLIILVGVVTDITSRVKGYLVSQKYESFKRV